MKKYAFLFLISFFCACSSFNEEVEFSNFQDAFDQIETKLPVINIVVDAADFSNMYNTVAEEIEIDGRFNLYRNQEFLIENEEVELEIKGNYSTRFPLRTLGVKFDDKYDNRERYLIDPPQILPGHNLDKIKAIRLRNSGNDFERTMLKDLSFTRLGINAGLDMELTYGEPSLVYINGDFYGLLNIRTEANTNGIAGLFAVDKDDVTLAKVTTHELIKKDGDFARIDAFVDAVQRKDIEMIKNEIDVNNFIDYMVFESYLGNVDWPHNNSRFYAIDGGKFRFIMFDLDNVGWLKLNKAPLTIVEKPREPNIITDLFFTLLENESFHQSFWDRYRHLIESGSVSSVQFNDIVDTAARQIQTEMELQIQKFETPGTLIEWEIELDKLKTLFEEREQIVKDFVN